MNVRTQACGMIVGLCMCLAQASYSIPEPESLQIDHITPIVDLSTFKLPVNQIIKFTENVIEDEPTNLTKVTKPKDDKATQITSKFKHVDKKVVSKVVEATSKHSNEVFTQNDLLAIISIESSFNPNAVSQLKVDPARGLMQIRPGVWRSIVDRSKIHQIDYNIEAGAKILNDYYRQTGSKIGAIHAYNVGITAYRRGTRSNNYVNKYKSEVKRFKQHF